MKIADKNVWTVVSEYQKIRNSFSRFCQQNFDEISDYRLHFSFNKLIYYFSLLYFPFPKWHWPMAKKFTAILNNWKEHEYKIIYELIRVQGTQNNFKSFDHMGYI
jgi:hypothetical protein